MTGPGPTALSEHLAGLRVVADDEVVRDTCQALVLDHVGCGLFGMGLPWTRIVRATVASETVVAGRAAVYGDTPGADAASAALVNGTAAHAFDLDDTHLPTMTHPGAVVIAAAVATGAEVEADGRSLLDAVVAGYEAMTRVGRAVGLRHGEVGFHGTSQLGPLGAAVAATRLLGGGVDGIHDALGVAASLGSGIKAFRQGPGMVKRLHAGRAAESGILAARLVANGFRGPARPLTGTFGLASVLALGDDVDVAVLAPDPADRLAVTDTYVKPYPACAALHGAMAAAEAIAAAGAFDPRAITRVDVGTSRRVLAQNDIPQPSDAMSAQYSMAWAIAVALSGKARIPTAFLDPADTINEPIRRMARLVQLHVDDEVDAAYPDRNMGRVDVTTGDNVTTRVATCAPDVGSGWPTAVEKFRATTHDVLAVDRQDHVIDTTAALGARATVAQLLEALVA